MHPWAIHDEIVKTVSDQFLYPMDSAFKRRWQWKSCSLSFDPVKAFLRGKRPILKDVKKSWDWITLVERLNAEILAGHLEDTSGDEDEDAGLMKQAADLF